MQRVAGIVLIAVAVIAGTYIWYASEGTVRYVMYGPAAIGCVLLYRSWRDE